MDFTKEEFKLLTTMLSECITFHTTQIPKNTGNQYRTQVAGQQARIQIADKVRKVLKAVRVMQPEVLFSIRLFNCRL
jgi:hypothetical protein